jgi:hypothetical protein
VAGRPIWVVGVVGHVEPFLVEVDLPNAATAFRVTRRHDP